MAAIDLKRRHVRELLEEIGVDHPYESNRLKSLISKILILEFSRIYYLKIMLTQRQTFQNTMKNHGTGG